MGGLTIDRGKGEPQGLLADRRLCVTADRSRAVEANDPAAAYLLVVAGRTIAPADVASLGLTADADGKVVLAGQDPVALEEAPAEAHEADAPKRAKASKGKAGR